MDNGPSHSIANMANSHFEHLLASWLHSTGLVSHQIQSFNKFLREKIQDIVTENSQVVVESEKGSTVRLTFESVYVRPPALREADGAYHRVTPHECRLRGLSYNAAVYANVRHTNETPCGEEHHKLYTEVLLCRIPCMVRCMACSYRHGNHMKNIGWGHRFSNISRIETYRKRRVHLGDPGCVGEAGESYKIISRRSGACRRSGRSMRKLETKDICSEATRASASLTREATSS